MSIKPKQKADLQILDLLHLSKKEQEIRELCRTTLKELGLWHKSVPDAIHLRALRNATIRGMILRSRARDAVHLFKITRRKRTQLFQSYIAALPSAHAGKRLAS